MTSKQFEIFCTFRKELKSYCDDFNKNFASELISLQKNASLKDTPPYEIENPVVYNTALDEITIESEIKKIVIGDNPGKNEQLSVNQKYLVGQAGKIAQGFFQKNPDFKTDFRKNVIILNKTPVHSAKTSHLKEILKLSSPLLKAKIEESIIFMAQKTADLHQKLAEEDIKQNKTPCELWLVGYSELKNKGIFLSYKDELKKNYYGENKKLSEFWKEVYIFQHFSMNRFSIDLNNFMKKNNFSDIVCATKELGLIHKCEIFGE